MAKVTFGYWGVRGLGQTSRLLLAYTGAQWEDHQYKTREEWFDKDKQGLGLTFPNLPYLIDGDVKLTESSAIQRYVVNRSEHKELLGKDEKDHARVDMLYGVLNDVRQAVFPLFWNPEWQKEKAAAFDKIKPKLEQFEHFIGNKDFTLGYLTVIDFTIAEMSYYFEKMYPEDYPKHPFLEKVRKNVESLPAIKAYYETPTAVKGPFNPPTAALHF